MQKNLFNNNSYLLPVIYFCAVENCVAVTQSDKYRTGHLEDFNSVYCEKTHLRNKKKIDHISLFLIEAQNNNVYNT